MNSNTKIYFSFSTNPGTFGATVFAALFARQKIDAVYLPRRAPDPAKIPIVLRALAASGCAISSPWKEAIVKELDEQDESVRISGSCNTLVLKEGRLKGFNTDIYGAREAVRGVSLERVAIYGAGGVVPSVVLALKEAGAKEIFLFGRNQAKVEARAEAVGIPAHGPGSSGEFSLLVNCTPSSPDLGGLEELVERAETVFDLVVFPADTPLLAHARKSGKKIIPGWRMGTAQLQRQFELYEGIQVPMPELEAIVESLYLRGDKPA